VNNNVLFIYDVTIGGDTRNDTAGAAIAVPLRILGQQPIQNAASTLMMFIIVIDSFSGVARIWCEGGTKLHENNLTVTQKYDEIMQ